MNCLTRLPAGNLYPDADLMALARTGFEEAAAVGRALGVKLPDDVVEWQVKNHLGFPPHMYASMYHDLVRGKRLEVESLSGLVSREGGRLGIKTPFHTMAYACLKPYANGAPVAKSA
jgi:2-dehydropantoate 2-reductase